MRFGLYVHIPYCLQKCHYCDFTTFDLNHKIKMPEYTQLILSEIRSRAKYISHKRVTSLYFGGGTPSLLPAQDIISIRNAFVDAGFEFLPDAEITIEINPGTIGVEKLDLYLVAGVNRFSVGVQTFDDALLKVCGREHSAQDSRETLRFLLKNNLLYSFDLLFGLPQQNLKMLEHDLDEMLEFSPPHVSLYNLTVPQKHFMNSARADDDTQNKMFDLIESKLREAGISRYEISNFSRPGCESKHNQIYWSDEPYWGVGVSAHSYLPDAGDFGTRFWNPTSAQEYAKQVSTTTVEKGIFDSLPPRQVERLKKHEAITDFCHTQLRMMRGLNYQQFGTKFGNGSLKKLQAHFNRLKSLGLTKETEHGFCLTPKAYPIANKVFLELTELSST